MDFTLYNNRKTKLQQTITSTLFLLQSLNLTSAHKRLTDDAVRLADERFNLVIIGEFSRGKSTFINALLGTERAIVSDVAGTTRDAVDTPFTYHGEEYVVIDTAGMRKRGKVYENVEKYDRKRGLKMKFILLK